MELVHKKKNFFQAFSHPRTLIKIRCPKPNLTSTPPIEASIIVMKGHHREQTATAEQNKSQELKTEITYGH